MKGDDSAPKIQILNWQWQNSRMRIINQETIPYQITFAPKISISYKEMEFQRNFSMAPDIE